MLKEVKDLLIKLATQYTLQAKQWDDTFGKAAKDHIIKMRPVDSDAKVIAYKQLVSDTEAMFAEIAPQLSALGYPAYNTTITGRAGGDIDHYYMDKQLDAIFGPRVSTDSESSQFYCYCADKDADEILEFVRMIGGQDTGETWETYGGDTGTASFNADEKTDWVIKGLENWDCAEELLEELS